MDKTTEERIGRIGWGIVGGLECFLGGFAGITAFNLSNFWTTKYSTFLELYLAKTPKIDDITYLQAVEFAENYVSNSDQQVALAMVGGLAGLLFADGILRMHRAYRGSGGKEEK